MNILTTITQNLQSSISKTQVRNARIKAIRSAVIAANVQHTDFQGIGFDASLLLNKTTSVMDPFLNDGLLPNADELATLWATTWANRNQFVTGTAQKAAANITPMVNDFIYALKTSELPSKTYVSPSAAQSQAAHSDSYPADAYLGLSNSGAAVQ